MQNKPPPTYFFLELFEQATMVDIEPIPLLQTWSNKKKRRGVPLGKC